MRHTYQHGVFVLVIFSLCLKDAVISQRNGDLRLAGGLAVDDGRVEVYFGTRWGTVCSTLFGREDAVVVCRQLGKPFTEVEVVTDGITFGSGTGPVWLSLLQCEGHEERVTDCRHYEWGQSTLCGHLDDVGVRCKGENVPTGQLRLMGGPTERSGRLEVFQGLYWSTVCSERFTDISAKVACRQLGFDQSTVAVYRDAYYGVGASGNSVGSVFCSGLETRLVDCIYNEFSSCTHSQDVSIQCGYDATPSFGTEATATKAASTVVVVGVVTAIVLVIVVICIVLIVCKVCRRSNQASRPQEFSVVTQNQQVHEAPASHQPMVPLAAPIPHKGPSAGYPVGPSPPLGSTGVVHPYPSGQHPYPSSDQIPSAPQPAGGGALPYPTQPYICPSQPGQGPPPAAAYPVPAQQSYNPSYPPPATSSAYPPQSVVPDLSQPPSAAMPYPDANPQAGLSAPGVQVPSYPQQPGYNPACYPMQSAHVPDSYPTQSEKEQQPNSQGDATASAPPIELLRADVPPLSYNLVNAPP